MNLSKKTLHNSIFSFAGFLWPLALFFLSIPYFISKLGTEQYGIWVLINSSVAMMDIFNLGIGDALIKFISEYRAKDDPEMVNKIVRNSFFIYIIVSIIIFIIGLLIIPSFSSFFRIKEVYKLTIIFVLRITLLGFIINLFTINALAIFKAIQRYDISSKVTILSDTIRILGMIVAIYFGFGLRGMAVAYVGGIIIGFLYILCLLGRNVPEISLRPSFEIHTIKKIFSFSFFSFLIGVSGIFRVNIGNILLGRFLGASIVPYFSIPFNMCQKILAGMSSLTTVLFPVFSWLDGNEEKNKIKEMFFNLNKLNVYIGLFFCSVMFLFSKSLLSIWISPCFSIYANIPFQILSVSFTFVMVSTVSYFFLMGSGLIRIIAAVQWISLFIIVVFIYFFGSLQGTIGVSIAYAFGNLFIVSYVYLSCKVLMGKNHWLKLKEIFIPSSTAVILVLILFSLIIRLNARTIQGLIVNFLITGATFSLFSFLFDHKYFYGLLKYFRKTESF